MNKVLPKFHAEGFDFYDLYVADAATHESGWRYFVIEIDSTYIFSVSFEPCDWQMHPRGKNMTTKVSSLSQRHEVGIREAIRLHDLSTKIYEEALTSGKTPQEAKALSQFSVVAASASR
jgi:hypothetical protein